MIPGSENIANIQHHTNVAVIQCKGKKKKKKEKRKRKRKRKRAPRPRQCIPKHTLQIEKEKKERARQSKKKGKKEKKKKKGEKERLPGTRQCSRAVEGVGCRV